MKVSNSQKREELLSIKWIDVLGEFENVHGERFVVFVPQLDNPQDVVFVAGDETDWEWHSVDNIGKKLFLSQFFILSEEEEKQLARILGRNKRKGVKNNGRRTNK